MPAAISLTQKGLDGRFSAAPISDPAASQPSCPTLPRCAVQAKGDQPIIRFVIRITGWLTHQKSLQLIISTLNYHGPFDRRSGQLTTVQTPSRRSLRRQGWISHDLFAALPKFHSIYPIRDLIVPRGAPAARVTIRSLAVASSSNGRRE
jgi:hypothetical protein